MRSAASVRFRSHRSTHGACVKGLAELDRSDPSQAQAIVERARSAVERLRVEFPGDAGTGVLALDPEEELAFAQRHGRLACPALDPESGACMLYEHRPLACRLYGPPLTVGGDVHPHCPLCFRQASYEEIERCRTTVEIEAVGAFEDAFEAALPPESGAPERTLIAFALAARPLQPHDGSPIRHPGEDGGEAPRSLEHA